MNDQSFAYMNDRVLSIYEPAVLPSVQELVRVRGLQSKYPIIGCTICSYEQFRFVVSY